VLYAVRSFLDIVALELRRRDVEIRDLRILVGTGEVIPASSRRLYRRRFGVELVETYGSVEMGVMAYETPDRDGLHLCSDLTYFEFLDDDGQPVHGGEPGRVVVTDLTGALMPFIRYDQGDLAICALSGTGNQADPRRLVTIIGRQDDLAVLPDGTLCTRPQRVAQIRKYDGILQFRFIQKAPDLFRILIVADTTYLEGIRDELLGWLQGTFPPEVRFEIVQVDQIEPDASGKSRALISEVKS
jgi:phenylacetate-CoA ligase